MMKKVKKEDKEYETINSIAACKKSCSDDQSLYDKSYNEENQTNKFSSTTRHLGSFGRQYLRQPKSRPKSIRMNPNSGECRGQNAVTFTVNNCSA